MKLHCVENREWEWEKEKKEGNEIEKYSNSNSNNIAQTSHLVKHTHCVSVCVLGVEINEVCGLHF